MNDWGMKSILNWDLGNVVANPHSIYQLCEHEEVIPNLCVSHVKWEGWINQQPVIDTVQ